MLLNTFTRIQFESGFVDMWDPVFGWTHSLLSRETQAALLARVAVLTSANLPECGGKKVKVT